MKNVHQKDQILIIQIDTNLKKKEMKFHRLTKVTVDTSLE